MSGSGRKEEDDRAPVNFRREKRENRENELGPKNLQFYFFRKLKIQKEN